MVKYRTTLEEHTIHNFWTNFDAKTHNYGADLDDETQHFEAKIKVYTILLFLPFLFFPCFTS